MNLDFLSDLEQGTRHGFYGLTDSIGKSDPVQGAEHVGQGFGRWFEGPGGEGAVKLGLGAIAGAGAAGGLASAGAGGASGGAGAGLEEGGGLAAKTGAAGSEPWTASGARAGGLPGFLGGGRLGSGTYRSPAQNDPYGPQNMTIMSTSRQQPQQQAATQSQQMDQATAQSIVDAREAQLRQLADQAYQDMYTPPGRGAPRGRSSGGSR